MPLEITHKAPLSGPAELPVSKLHLLPKAKTRQSRKQKTDVRLPGEGQLAFLLKPKLLRKLTNVTTRHRRIYVSQWQYLSHQLKVHESSSVASILILKRKKTGRSKETEEHSSTICYHLKYSGEVSCFHLPLGHSTRKNKIKNKKNPTTVTITQYTWNFYFIIFPLQVMLVFIASRKIKWLNSSPSIHSSNLL